MTFAKARLTFLLVVGTIVLSGCGSETPIPGPRVLTRDSNGFYCNMIIVDHPGPKAQVFEKDHDKPYWFPSVRDALAYVMLPGEAQRILAFYVHDMGRAKSWKTPQNDGIWIKAEDAFFVLDSKRRGGMGARETIPFMDRAAAKSFVSKYGGRIASYSSIPQDYVLGVEDDDFGRTSPPDVKSNE